MAYGLEASSYDHLSNIQLELLSYIIQICYRYSQDLNLEIPYPKAFLFQL